MSYIRPGSWNHGIFVFQLKFSLCCLSTKFCLFMIDIVRVLVAVLTYDAKIFAGLRKWQFQQSVNSFPSSCTPENVRVVPNS